MVTITIKQYDSLVQRIYDTLIQSPEMGLGEMGECRDEAKRIVDEWMKDQLINFDETLTPTKP